MTTTSTTAAAGATATVIKGSADVVIARQIIPDGVVRQDLDGSWVGAIRCPTAVVGLVAGKEQKNLREIALAHAGFRIEIARRRQDIRADQQVTLITSEKQSFTDWLSSSRCSNINVISPSKELTESGLRAVKERVETASRRAPFTHCICLPFLEKDNPQFVQAIENFKKRVAAKARPEDGIDTSVMISSKQIHFTLLMLMIYDEETLDKVIKLLDEFVEARKLRGVPRFPLTLRFTGIHIFDTDKPNSASVVFTHAGRKRILEPEQITTTTISSADVSILDSASCTRTAQALTQASDRVKSLLTPPGKVNEEVTQQLLAVQDAIVPASESLKELAKNAPRLVSDNAAARRRPRDVSTVTGPQVHEIFELFCDLVQKLTDAGVLTESDRRERRITTNPDGTLSETSLTLHVTLMSAKWRSPTATRNLQGRIAPPPPQAAMTTGVPMATMPATGVTVAQGAAIGTGVMPPQTTTTTMAPQAAGIKTRKPPYRRGRNTRPLAALMNVADFLSETEDFGNAMITQLHLSRRANTGAEMLTVEKAFNLC